MGAADDRVDRIRAEWQLERPDLDTSPVAVIGRLHRLAAHLTQRLCDVYAEFGLTEGEFDVLAALRRAGPPYERVAGELATVTMVTTGGLTKRIDRLESAGLVRRRRSTADGRERMVRLTAAGRRLIDEAFAAHVENERRLLAVLDAADRRDLERILRRWLSEFE